MIEKYTDDEFDDFLKENLGAEPEKKLSAEDKKEVLQNLSLLRKDASPKKSNSLIVKFKYFSDRISYEFKIKPLKSSFTVAMIGLILISIYPIYLMVNPENRPNSFGLNDNKISDISTPEGHSNTIIENEHTSKVAILRTLVSQIKLVYAQRSSHNNVSSIKNKSKFTLKIIAEILGNENIQIDHQTANKQITTQWFNDSEALPKSNPVRLLFIIDQNKITLQIYKESNPNIQSSEISIDLFQLIKNIEIDLPQMLILTQ
jgi:hypothetical protein